MKQEQMIMYAGVALLGWFFWTKYKDSQKSWAVDQGDAPIYSRGMSVDGRGLTDTIRNAGAYEPITSDLGSTIGGRTGSVTGGGNANLS